MNLEDIVNDKNMVVVCSNNDAVKKDDVYVPLPKPEVLELMSSAEEQDYKVSHGICPPCYDAIILEIKNHKIIDKYISNLDDIQKVKVCNLNSDMRVYYDKLILLVNQPDYKRLMATARHTSSPCSDVKGRLLKGSLSLALVEDVGLTKDLENVFVDNYNIAKNTYEDLKLK